MQTLFFLRLAILCSVNVSFRTCRIETGDIQYLFTVAYQSTDRLQCPHRHNTPKSLRNEPSASNSHVLLTHVQVTDCFKHFGSDCSPSSHLQQKDASSIVNALLHCQGFSNGVCFFRYSFPAPRVFMTGNADILLFAQLVQFGPFGIDARNSSFPKPL